jgi:hypothetical protein
MGVKMNVINQTLERIEIGMGTTFENLTLFPLFDPKASLAEPDYLTLDEALTQKVAHITEVSESGSVPELKFVNESDQRILLLDGEELQGAKQNRILNLTILVAARQTLLVPVSCVEAGRWSRRSAEFATAGHAHYASGRARKMGQVTESLSMRGGRHSDQGEVWADIAAKASRMAAPSPTSAASALYEQNADDIERFVRAFTTTSGARQVGALFGINGRIIGLDLFDYPATLTKLLAKLVRSNALDAIDAGDEPKTPLTRDNVDGFLHLIADAQMQQFPAIAEGEDIRLTVSGLTGGALIADARVVHLSAFQVDEIRGEYTQAPPTTAMSRPSLRSRHSWR